MSWYSEYRNEWKEIIEAVARECKRAELMVEKDTVQSMFLLELSKIDLPFVFKGGTSLSKAYNRIDRFSEDIDLSMNRKPTQTERKASKEHIVEIAKSSFLARYPQIFPFPEEPACPSITIVKFFF